MNKFQVVMHNGGWFCVDTEKSLEELQKQVFAHGYGLYSNQGKFISYLDIVMIRNP